MPPRSTFSPASVPALSFGAADAERWLAAIVESSEDAILSKDLNGVIRSWNASAQRLFGYAAGEVIGLPVTILIPAERQDEEVEILDRIRRGERIEHFETSRRRRDGTCFDVSLTISPVKDETGRVIGASKIVRDITDRKQALAALRLSEERFRLFTSHAPVGIFLSDAAGRCTFVNERWCEMTGLDPARAEGTGWADAVHPADRARVVGGWREAVAAGAPSVSEFRFRRPDGGVVWVQGHAVRIDDAPGAKSYLGSCIDITARKEAELQAAFLHWLSDQLAGLTDPDQIVDVAQAALGEHLEANRCYFFEMLQGENLAVVRRDWRTAGLASVAGHHPLDQFGSPEFLAWLAQPRAAIADVTTHAVTRERTAAYAALGMRGLATSTLSKDGRRMLSLAVCSSQPREWLPSELDLVENVTARVWPAIERARAARELRASSRTLEILNRAGNAMVAEHELEKIVQAVTDAGREISGANFGAFFYNVTNAAGESYMLYTLSGVPREAFAKFPMPRATAMFGPTFRGEGTIRVADVLADPRYGKSAPHHGMPQGHLPVRSYLAVPVVSRSGEVLGGLFFGHAQPGMFTAEAENVVTALASQAAIAIDNAKLYAALQRELEEQRRTEAMLRDSENRWRQLAEAMPHLVWTCRADGFCDYLSPQWVAYTGRPEPDQLGEGWLGCVHPDDREPLTRRWAEAVSVGAYFDTEFRIRRADGNYRWFKTRAIPIRDGEGRIVKWYGTNTDIEDFRRIERAIRDSEHQLRLVTDHAPIYLAHIDRGHRIKFVNRTYAERYGRAREDIIGRHVSEITGPVAYETFRLHMDATLAGRRSEFEQEIPYATLGRRWVHVIYEPERAVAGGEVSGLVAVVVDITARKQAELELEKARDDALAASRAKDDFLAALSHELRTPLSPVLLVASDAANNPALPREIRETFEMIRGNVSLEARLIDDLLDLTRITRGKMSLEKHAVDVHAVLHDAVANIRAELDEKAMVLELALEAGDATVTGDAVRLQQVLWNILKNAAKFTADGGRVRVATRVADGLLVVEVADNGIGMSAGELGGVFEAFAQGEHARSSAAHRFGGLGLGLAIARKLVELHGGRIYARSPGRGHGSTFIVELPLPAPTRPASAAPSVTGEAGPVLPVAPVAGCILLVEDHASTRATMQKLLIRRNYEVVPAGTAKEARQLAAARPFDFLLSDVGLPDGDGYQLMSELKKMQPSLRGIAVSGYGMEDDLQRSRAAGFAAHLVKPVSIAALEKALAALAQPTA